MRQIDFFETFALAPTKRRVSASDRARCKTDFDRVFDTVFKKIIVDDVRVERAKPRFFADHVLAVDAQRGF